MKTGNLIYFRQVVIINIHDLSVLNKGSIFFFFFCEQIISNYFAGNQVSFPKVGMQEVFHQRSIGEEFLFLITNSVIHIEKINFFTEKVGNDLSTPRVQFV